MPSISHSALGVGVIEPASGGVWPTIPFGFDRGIDHTVARQVTLDRLLRRQRLTTKLGRLN